MSSGASPRPAPSRLALLALSGLLGACTAVPPQQRDWCPAPAGDPSRRIHLVSQGWHTGIVFARAHIPPALAAYYRDFPDAQYIEVGWGDHDFYMAEEFSLFLSAKALFWPTRSVLHVVGFDGQPSAVFTGSRIVAVDLAAEALPELLEYVHRSFAVDEHGGPIRLRDGLYLDSAFYLSKERYQLFRTSNTWAARALREAACPIVPFTAFTVELLQRKAGEFGRRVR